MYFQQIKVSVNRSRKDESSNRVDSEAFKLHQDEPKKTFHDGNIPIICKLSTSIQGEINSVEICFVK